MDCQNTPALSKISDQGKLPYLGMMSNWIRRTNLHSSDRSLLLVLTYACITRDTPCHANANYRSTEPKPIRHMAGEWKC